MASEGERRRRRRLRRRLNFFEPFLKEEAQGLDFPPAPPPRAHVTARGGVHERRRAATCANAGGR